MMLLRKKIIKLLRSSRKKPASNGKREKTLPRSQEGAVHLNQFWDNNLHVWEANPNLLEFRMPQKWHPRPNKPPPSHHKGGEFQPGHTLHIQNAASISVTNKIVSPPLVPSSHFQQLVLDTPPLPSPPHRTRRAHYCCPRTESDFQSEDSATIRNPKRWEEGQKCEMLKKNELTQQSREIETLQPSNLLFSLRLCAPLRPSPWHLPPSLPFNLSLLV